MSDNARALHESDLPSRRRSSARRGIVAALATVLLVPVMVALGPATAHAAIWVWSQHARDLTVSAYGSTDDGCTTTSTTLDASATRVLYSAWSYNACTGEESGVYGWTAPTSFSVRGNLATAHVVATIPLTNAYTGEPAGQILVDDTWTATERATTSTYSYTANVPGEYRYISRSSGSVSPAVVTGTVPLDEGYVWKIRSMEISVTHV